MEKNNPNECCQADEIDLYDLWLVLKKRRITILLIALISLSAAFAYAVLAPKVYRITNTVVINQIQEKDEVELINPEEIIAVLADLDTLLKHQKEKAAHLLNMQGKDLNGIRNIKASRGKNLNVVRVDIETFDSRAGIALMEALPGYLQWIPNIAVKLDMQKVLMEKNRDDLKAIIDDPMRDLKLSPNTVVYVPSIDLYTLREKYNRLNMMMEKMEKGQIVFLVWKNEPPEKQYKPKRVMSVLLGLVLGSFLGFFVAIFLEWSGNARRVRGFK